MLSELRTVVTRSLMMLRVEAAPQQAQQPPPPLPQMTETHPDPATGLNEMARPGLPIDDNTAPGASAGQAEDDWSKTSRNALCPCGSGKKYKRCHGSVATQRA